MGTMKHEGSHFSLGPGTSSQRSTRPLGVGNPVRSHPIEITTSAEASCAAVTLVGVAIGIA